MARSRERLGSLRSYELVEHRSGASGYVPTITARELLDLDVDREGVVIVEVPDDP